MAEMPKLKQATRKILLTALVEDDAITVPNLLTLDPAVQTTIATFMGSLGGRWHAERQTYTFHRPTGLDLADRYYEVVTEGAWTGVDNSRVLDTPVWLAQRMVEIVDVRGDSRVLEPSAGNGALLTEILERVNDPSQVTACEIMDDRRAWMTEIGLAEIGKNFLLCDFGPVFDRVVMHPPFLDGVGVTHVWHAMTQLRPGGRLISVLPPGLIGRQDRHYRELRQELLRNGSVVVPAETSAVGRALQSAPVLGVWTRPASFTPPTHQQAQNSPPVVAGGSGAPEWPQTPVPQFRRLRKP